MRRQCDSVTCHSGLPTSVSTVNFSVLFWGGGWWQLILLFKLNSLGKLGNQLVKHYSIGTLFPGQRKSLRVQQDRPFGRQFLRPQTPLLRHSCLLDPNCWGGKWCQIPMCDVYCFSLAKEQKNEGLCEDFQKLYWKSQSLFHGPTWQEGWSLWHRALGT